MSVKLGLDASGYKSSIEQASNSTKAFTNQVTKIKASLPNLKKEYMSTNRETMNLTLAVSRLTKEQKQTAEGRQMIKMLEETKAKAAELKDMILDTNDEIKQMASDTQQLDIMSECDHGGYELKEKVIHYLEGLVLGHDLQVSKKI